MSNVGACTDLLLTGMQLFLIEDGQPISTSVAYRGIIVLEEHIDQVRVLLTHWLCYDPLYEPCFSQPQHPNFLFFAFLSASGQLRCHMLIGLHAIQGQDFSMQAVYPW